MKLPILPVLLDIKFHIMETARQANQLNEPFQELVACRIGCSYCCSRRVEISIAEAIVIRDQLINSGSWSKVLEKCKTYKDLYEDLDSNSWFMMNIKCPVLNTETNVCGVYDVRPVSCSTHFALTSSEACDPWYTGDKKESKIDYEDLVQKFYKKVLKEASPIIYAYILPIHEALVLAEHIHETPDMNHEELVKTLGR